MTANNEIELTQVEIQDMIKKWKSVLEQLDDDDLIYTVSANTVNL